MPAPTPRHSRLKVALVVAGWLVLLLVLVALAPASLKAVVAIAFGAPTFAFILRNYLNWPPKDPYSY